MPGQFIRRQGVPPGPYRTPESRAMTAPQTRSSQPPAPSPAPGNSRARTALPTRPPVAAGKSREGSNLGGIPPGANRPGWMRWPAVTVSADLAAPGQPSLPTPLHRTAKPCSTRPHAQNYGAQKITAHKKTPPFANANGGAGTEKRPFDLFATPDRNRAGLQGKSGYLCYDSLMITRSMAMSSIRRISLAGLYGF